MRIWYIKRLLQFGVQVEDLIAVYVRQIRSVCEFAVQYWGPMITQGEVRRLEKIQRTVLHVILGNNYTSYREALLKVNLETLEERRKNLCIKFAVKTSEQQKFRHWFERNSEKCNNTRSVMDPWKLPKIRTDRFKKSPIPYYTRMLNELHSNWGTVITEKIFNCNQCEQSFSSSHNLAVHVRIIHICHGTDPQWSTNMK